MSQEVNELNNSTMDSTPDPTPDPTQKSVPPQSLDAKLARISEMIAGIQAHAEPLEKRGLDAAFMTQFSADYQALVDAHNAQLACKARMMEKTEEIRAKLSQIQRTYSDARAQVKRIFPKSTWREFGITDQRL
ncbi:hypothetical protein EDC14_1002255 [Hydrogenispora ethanolica]|uniref:Uncharacterized protein n=1 Tax=Hydrogenispora ethanolica TaxID=1082276 RepID=A0A4R1SAF3_HYDET|nr:hypothetical protein [Hydrogenispora ethanolica]TCL76496.1 hypothetical protein EDC14_1002255 [Hydrogenispora ethanolica]